MFVIPAIDIKDGKVVRLKQGHFDQLKIYSDDPVVVAKKWEASGAEWIHAVDLDGAQSGQAKNFNIISSMVTAVKIPIQLGGGIRTKYDIACFLASGVARVILGTKAIESPEFLSQVLREWPGKIVVSLDCVEGKVAHHGWLKISDVQATDFSVELEDLGVKTLIYTDISRDGTLSGPNIENIALLLKSVKHMRVIASGGVSTLEDLKQLLRLKSQGLIGVIVGKALYEQRLDLTEAIRLCSPNG